MILEETVAQSVSSVARTHGIAKNLLFRWRKQAGMTGKWASKRMANKVSGKVLPPSFLPVTVDAKADAVQTRAVNAGSADSDACASNGVIEIELVSGHRLKVRGPVDAQVLKHVIASLTGGPVRRSTECEGG